MTAVGGGEGRRSRGGRRTAPFRPAAPSVPSPFPAVAREPPAKERARVTRPGSLAPSRAPASAARSWPRPRRRSRSEASRVKSWGRRRGPSCPRLAASQRCPRTPAAIAFAPGWRGRCTPRRSAQLPGARRSAAARAGGGARSRTPAPVSPPAPRGP